jgi:N utilization substance protein A
MRGSRVKNIVSELQGEKIDIVRYADDIKEYIQAALSPAEISQIQINYDEKKANLIVAEDQLSLSIGKRGQNVRLASKLVGWELNIYTAEQWDQHQRELDAEEGAEQSEDEKPDSKPEVKVDDSALRVLKGVGEKLRQMLVEFGFETPEKIAKAAPDELTKIKGLGKVKAEKLIAQAKELFKDQEPGQEQSS